jgi:hypothetical protein
MLRREIAEAEAWGKRALVVADLFGHVETRVEALVTLASARLLVDPDADAGLRAAHETAHQAGQREEAQRAFGNLAYVLMNWARAGAALEALRAGVAYAEKHELHHMAPYSILTERWLQLRAGPGPSRRRSQTRRRR